MVEKKLKPSMRENKRYLKIAGSKDKVETAILDFMGIFGYSKAGMVWVKPGILGVNREMLNQIKASLSLAGIKISKISGTLAGLGRK